MAERATPSIGPLPGRRRWVARSSSMKIDTDPEEVAQAIFANARPPDPSRRIHSQPKDPERTG